MVKTRSVGKLERENDYKPFLWRFGAYRRTVNVGWSVNTNEEVTGRAQGNQISDPKRQGGTTTSL